MGSAGGSQSHVQTTAELVTHNHGVTDPGHTHTATPSAPNAIGSGGGYNGGNAGSISNPALTVSIGSSTTGISVNNNGSSNAMAWLQPTMMLNCILRVI
jgi:hypothetical protein